MRLVGQIKYDELSEIGYKASEIGSLYVSLEALFIYST